MAAYDLPAMLDHALEVTGKKDLIYIGHSMGTTIFFAMASTRPEYHDKISLMIGLAPVAFVQNFRCPLRLLAPFVDNLEVGNT